MGAKRICVNDIVNTHSARSLKVVIKIKAAS